MKMLLKIAAAVAALLLGAFYLLTPASERGQSAFRLYKPGQPDRTVADPGHVWKPQRGGSVVRIDEATGKIVGRFADTSQAEAEIVASWSANNRKGFLLAPHIGGKRLFFIHRGSDQGMKVDAYLKRVAGGPPAV
jgi:hypothetical protein